jgi:hypothetical protein
VRQIVLQGQNPQARLNVPVRNYGLEATDISVRLESLTPGLEILNEVQTIDRLRTSEVRVVPFEVKISNFNMESSVRIRVTMTSAEGERAFLNDIPVSRDVKSEASFKKLAFQFKAATLPVGNIENGKVVSYLNTVETYGKSKAQEFYLRRVLKEEKKLMITLLRRTSKGIVEVANPIVIEKFSSLINFLRLDLNLDGEDDYLVQAVVENAKGDKEFHFSFYDNNLKPLWSQFQSVGVTIDLLIKNMSDLSFARMDHPELGKMLVPVFFTEGQIPKLDQTKDFYGRLDVSRENRLYYLEPQVKEKLFRIRTFTHPAWREQVKKELNSKWFETVLVENILPISEKDVAAGKVRAIISVGQGTKRQIFISSFDTRSVLRGRTLPQIVLQTEFIDTLYAVTPKGLEAVGESYLNVYDRSRAKIVQTKESGQSHQLNYTHEAETDLIISEIAAFENGDEKLSILQTRDELVSLLTKEGKTIRSSRPKLRYSFFSAKVLSEMYLPVIYSRTHQAPALYVDSTGVTGNRVYLFEEQEGKLVSSVQNSLIVPFETQRTERGVDVIIACKALNPSYVASTAAHEFTFLCLENKEWFIRTYEMR